MTGAAIAGCCGLLIAAPCLAGPISMTEVGLARGIGTYTAATGLATGVCVADFDNDGDPDIFVPNRFGTPDQLYRNEGSGQFTNVAAALGVASTDNNRSALWFDYDGDDDLDLAVVSDTHGRSLAGQNTITLYEYDAGVYSDVTAAAGLPASLLTVPGINQDAHAGGVSAGDLDADGDLDLVVVAWQERTHVFLNDGDGTFTSAGPASGIDIGETTRWQAMVVDLNDDALADVLLSYDFGANELFVCTTANGGGGVPVFSDAAPAAGIDTAFNEMGIAAGDPDNDGDLDFYMTNIFGTDPSSGASEHNVLFRNDSTPGGIAFAEVAQAAGVDEGGIGWGCSFADFNNDGWEDLAEANVVEPVNAAPIKLWENDGPGLTFTDVSASSGFATFDPCTSLAAFDMEGDGDLDVVVPTLIGQLRLMENQLVADGTNNHLVVRPRMPGMNRRAIGATVTVTRADGTSTRRLITAGTSFAGQEPASAFFGLGDDTAVPAVEVTWPDKTRTRLTNVSANQVLTVTSDCACGAAAHDVNADGVADIDDLYAAHQTPADVNGDGVTDAVDRACVERFIRRNEIRPRRP